MTERATFTQGPWKAWQERAPQGPWIVDMPDGGNIHIGHLPNGLPDEANARLIAAAPDLYDALWDACDHCSDCGGEGVCYAMDETEIGQTPGSSAYDCPMCTDWRTALRKARGK